MQVQRISHASFRTPDLERQVDYYCNSLGLHVVARETGRAFLATRTGLLCVVLESGDVSACDRLAFQVAPDTDLLALRRTLDGEGVAAELQDDTGPGLRRRLSFQDPKGTWIDIHAEVEMLEQDRSGQAALMPLKLGHLAFHVNDMKQITDFYIGVLGFRASDWRADIFAFLRCGPDHHTVNFFLSHTGVQKFHHIAFELKDAAEVLRSADFLGHTDGTRVIWGPGRHLIGHNMFTYHRNPEGQVVELYAEMDQMKSEALGYFDPRPWHQDRPQRPKVWPMNVLSNYWGAGSPPGFAD